MKVSEYNLIIRKQFGQVMNRLLSGYIFTLLVLFATQPSQSQVTRPNIVLITTDQQFSDAMSYRMGKEWIHTPNLDKLATGGMFFSRAYAANPLCGPSRNAMVTGQYPHITGIQKNSDLAGWGGSKGHHWTSDDFKSLGTYFKGAGYKTGYFGKWHLNYRQSDQQAHGFETMLDISSHHGDASIPGAVNTFLKKKNNSNKPFMLWASFVNPHDICQWARFQKLPQGPIGKLPPVSHWPPIKGNFAPPENETEAMTLMRKSYHNNRRLFPVGNYSNFDWRRLRWGYYRLVEKVDAQIGRLFEVLKKNGYGENTVIIFTSDHGETAGSHHFNQKTVFYEESARVPLIINYPNKVQRGSNKSLVNTGTDLLPTLLDFAHITKPKELPGVSLKQVAESSNGKLLSRDYIVIENEMAQGGPVNGKVPNIRGRMVRGERYKYCLYDTLGHREALFDLKNDPEESINIAKQDSANPVVIRYRKYLNDFAKDYKDKKALHMLQYIDTHTN